MDTIDAGRDQATATESSSRPAAASPRARPRGRPYSREIDWRMFALVGASIAAGAALGAGIALLTAPQSGEHTRLALGREYRRHRPWSKSPWDKLGDALTEAAERRNKRLSRAERARQNAQG